MVGVLRMGMGCGEEQIGGLYSWVLRMGMSCGDVQIGGLYGLWWRYGSLIGVVEFDVGGGAPIWGLMEYFGGMMEKLNGVGGGWSHGGGGSVMAELRLGWREHRSRSMGRLWTWIQKVVVEKSRSSGGIPGIQCLRMRCFPSMFQGLEEMVCRRSFSVVNLNRKVFWPRDAIDRPWACF
uniref:Uncharacterized protein n=1 Tax=Fagus sylvatica TaxID=28930 RepID=A0A2N9HV60_FAGSY